MVLSPSNLLNFLELVKDELKNFVGKYFTRLFYAFVLSELNVKVL